MDKKEEELLSMHYQIEKTDVKQQKLEDRLLSISKDLENSRKVRNFYFAFIILLMLVLIIGSFYVTNGFKNFSPIDEDVEQLDSFKNLQITNDSLLKEVTVLKENVSVYEKNFLIIDSAAINADTVNNKSKSKFERKYCYAKKAFRSNDAVFIEADFIEYFEGKKAVIKAKEFGEAEYDIDKNEDTLYFLYNNYYIHNQNDRTKILELDDRVRVKIDNINQISNAFPLKAFQKIIADKPILILEVSNGVVYGITEQKLP